MKFLRQCLKVITSPFLYFKSDKRPFANLQSELAEINHQVTLLAYYMFNKDIKLASQNLSVSKSDVKKTLRSYGVK
ncbi:hypothetical protein [Fangia hongkongensis]|uniref:hypothetical protein n=1 Tax=Fangia hongkongensis TaxID=270495 RepID=UPI0003603039|nr:hypothetical protein [Fangia hongkongensis]MBK2123934.1 hypothetical protein [Fangia hongkongensis]